MTGQVSLEKKDALQATLTIRLTPDVYKPKVEEQIQVYRRKANIPGFRKGMAPMGIIKKMVGKSIFVDEINKMASDALYNYLRDEQIDILGEPLPSADLNPEIDFDQEGDFTFYFDLGLAPEFELNFTPKDKLIRYNITPTAEDLDEEIQNILRRYGKLESIQKSEQDKDSISGLLTELDENGHKLEGGIENKSTTVLLEMIEDLETRESLRGKGAGDAVNVDIYKLFNHNEGVISSTTSVPKEGLSDLNPTFKLEISEVKRFSPAEENQDLYDKVFGAGEVSDAETFRAKVKESMERYYLSEAEHHLDHMIQHLIMENHPFELPDAFLKRWLVQSYSDQYADDNIEEKYGREASGLKMHLITEKVMKTYQIEVSREELDQTSIGYTMQMLRQYGLNNPDPSLVASFEKKNREDKTYMNKIRDMVLNGKMYEKVKELITIESKDITSKEFYAMIEDHNTKHNH